MLKRHDRVRFVNAHASMNRGLKKRQGETGTVQSGPAKLSGSDGLDYYSVRFDSDSYYAWWIREDRLERIADDSVERQANSLPGREDA